MRIFNVVLVFCLLCAGVAEAVPVQFDFSGYFGDGSQNGNTSFGTIAQGTYFHGTVIYDTDTEGIAVGNDPGVPIDTPDPNWDKKQYAFTWFSLTIGTETFSMSGHDPSALNSEPYGTIFITNFPTTDQFFVKISGNRHGFGNIGRLFGGKDVMQIQVAFSGQGLFNSVGTNLMTAETLQDRFDASTRAVMTLIEADTHTMYTVTSSIKQGTAYSPAPVPEPATILLMGVGLGCIGLFGRKAKKKITG